MILSKDREKAFDKIQHPFLIETLQQVGIAGTYLNVIKVKKKKTNPKNQKNTNPPIKGKIGRSEFRRLYKYFIEKFHILIIKEKSTCLSLQSNCK